MNTHHQTRHTKGVALLEVLVAILLFALGVLALVGLQGALTRAQTDAKIRTDASALASEVIGRMWADLGQLNAYNGTDCKSHPRCKSWQDKVTQTLPSGIGTITVTAATSDVAVNITWTTPGGETHRYETHTTIIGNAATP
jgi:type IV pilus assembly protein PilV